MDKSAAYLEMLPLFSQGRLELLDHRQQTRELQCLERRTRAGGRDVVDHPRGGHDDHANALALSIPPDRAGLALDEWRDDLHVIDEFSVPPFWTFAAGLEFAYREGGIFVLFAVGPDGDMVGVEELTLHRTNAHRAGRLIAELCRQHVSEQLSIGSGERVWLKSGAPTLGEELMAGICEVYDPSREFTPVIMTSAEGPAADAARLAILHRYLEWTAGPDGTVPSWGRPRLKFTRKCPFTVQGLASLALDPGDRERVLENPAYDAVTAALMSRPMLPERPPEPRSQQQHPGFTKRGKRKKYEGAMQRELEGPPEYELPKWHNPRPEDLEIVE